MTFTDRIANFPSSILNKDANSNLGKLYSVFATGHDELLNAVEPFYLINNIKEQTGKNLDRIGEILGQPRDGMLDDRYKLYLIIAIQKRLSRGDINSINSISTLILEESLLIREEFKGVPIFLDGTRILDGSWRLSGSTTEPATILMEFAGEEININIDLVNALNQVRAAGVRAKFDYAKSIPIDSMFFYMSKSLYLDGSWNLNGSRYLRGDRLAWNIAEIAVGNGGQTPDGTESGLYNEVLRRSVNTEFQNGFRNFYITLNFAEYNEEQFNEIAIFTPDGLLIAYKNFDAITKKSGYVLNFKITGGY